MTPPPKKKKRTSGKKTNNKTETDLHTHLRNISLWEPEEFARCSWCSAPLKFFPCAQVSRTILALRIPKSDTAYAVEKTFPNLLLRTGDTGARAREQAKSFILEESAFTEVKVSAARSQSQVFHTGGVSLHRGEGECSKVTEPSPSYWRSQPSQRSR